MAAVNNDRIDKLSKTHSDPKQIASILNISLETVKDRLKKLNHTKPIGIVCSKCKLKTFACKNRATGTCYKCENAIPDNIEEKCQSCGSELGLSVMIAKSKIRISRKYCICDNCKPQSSASDRLSWLGRKRKKYPTQELWANNPNVGDKVLVLGAGGFVGTNLVNYLSEYEVLTPGREECDASNKKLLDRYIRTSKPKIVINLAAFVGGIGLNRENPADMIYRNLMIGTNVVESCYRNGIRKLIQLSTVCSYPLVPNNIPFKECDLWLGRPESTNEPYGVAKKTVGLMQQAYWNQYNFSSVYLIPTNMYGPNDDFSNLSSHVIPAMIKKIEYAKRSGLDKVVLWGDGSPSRDFLYVGDCCQAIVNAIQNVDEPVPINIGSGVETNMVDLVEMISHIIGYTGEIVWDASKPNGQPRRCLDITLARRLLNFSPSTKLNDGLSKTFEWYRTNNDF